jgi:putative resolvase
MLALLGIWWYSTYMASLVPIGVAAREMGVHPDTLRRWEKEGRIDPAERTPGGKRRYDLTKLRHLGPHKAPSFRTTIAYARVSTSGQKDDLTRQVALLESFCAAQGWNYEVICDVGSGLNYHKRGLKQLIFRICSGEIGRLVLSHKDHLLRFGAELVFTLCEHFGVEVVIINASSESSFEEDLAQDVIEIVTVFSARLYGSRSHKNKQVMEQLRSIAGEVST